MGRSRCCRGAARPVADGLRTRPDRGADLEYGYRPRTVPATARASADPIIDRRLLARARASFDRHRNSLRDIDVVAIVDFSKASSESRFFLLDTNSGRVTRHLVAHGRGSDPAHTASCSISPTGPVRWPPPTALRHQPYYSGRYGRSMRVRGLDFTNNNAEARAIVVHSAWYAEPQVAAVQGRLGRSEGCFSLSYQSLQETLARLGPGHFIYADRLA